MMDNKKNFSLLDQSFNITDATDRPVLQLPEPLLPLPKTHSSIMDDCSANIHDVGVFSGVITLDSTAVSELTHEMGKVGESGIVMEGETDTCKSSDFTALRDINESSGISLNPSISEQHSNINQNERHNPKTSELVVNSVSIDSKVKMNQQKIDHGERKDSISPTKLYSETNNEQSSEKLQCNEKLGSQIKTPQLMKSTDISTFAVDNQNIKYTPESMSIYPQFCSTPLHGQTNAKRKFEANESTVSPNRSLTQFGKLSPASLVQARVKKCKEIVEKNYQMNEQKYSAFGNKRTCRRSLDSILPNLSGHSHQMNSDKCFHGNFNPHMDSAVDLIFSFKSLQNPSLFMGTRISNNWKDGGFNNAIVNKTKEEELLRLESNKMCKLLEKIEKEGIPLLENESPALCPNSDVEEEICNSDILKAKGDEEEMAKNPTNTANGRLDAEKEISKKTSKFIKKTETAKINNKENKGPTSAKWCSPLKDKPFDKKSSKGGAPPKSKLQFTTQAQKSIHRTKSDSSVTSRIASSETLSKSKLGTINKTFHTPKLHHIKQSQAKAGNKVVSKTTAQTKVPDSKSSFMFGRNKKG